MRNRNKRTFTKPLLRSVSDAIVNPVRTKRSPRLGPVAVIAATLPDLQRIRRLAGLGENTARPLYIGKIYVPENSEEGICVAGPVVGAPYSVMVLESLIAWGAAKVIFVGWCGAVSPGVSIGDLILPDRALIDEGTSRHYSQPDCSPCAESGGRHRAAHHYSAASPRLTRKVKQVLRAGDWSFHQGSVWSTDAIYRETPHNVACCQKQDILAVEMEMSALFSVARFRRIELAGLLVVSDDLSDFTWHPGFKQERFRRARRAACEAAFAVSRQLMFSGCAS